MAFIDIKTNIDSFINTFSKEIKPAIRKEVVQNGLDEQLSKDLDDLKMSLEDILEERNYKSKSQITTEAEVDEVNLKNTDIAWLKYLTGADLDQYNSASDYATAIGSKVAMVNYYRSASTSPTDSIRMGVKLRLETDPGDTFDNSYSNAIRYFNGSVFVIVDSTGNSKYLMNPGYDLSRFIKVVCSTDTGDTVKSRKRFETHKVRRGYADWSLNAEGMQFVKDNFINLTPIIEFLKNGDVDNALTLIQATDVPSNFVNNLENLQEKVTQAADTNNLTPDTQLYSNIKSLIKNLKISKQINGTDFDNVTIYTLISSYEDIADQQFADFFEKFQKELSLWKISNEKVWVEALLKKINKVIARTIERINA